MQMKNRAMIFAKGAIWNMKSLTKTIAPNAMEPAKETSSVGIVRYVEVDDYMKIGTKEHYDILESFEKNFYYLRLDREPAEIWSTGQVYQNGETNNAYTAYIAGYALGRAVYM